MSGNPPVSYFVGSLITSVVGALMLLTGEFAGWEYQVLYYESTFLSRTGSISLLSPYGVIIAFLAALLLYGAYVSYQGFRSGETPLPRLRLQLAFYGATLVSLVSLIGGVVFLVIMAIEDPNDWWLDLGFYGGVVSGALTALFFRLSLRSV